MRERVSVGVGAVFVLFVGLACKHSAPAFDDASTTSVAAPSSAPSASATASAAPHVITRYTDEQTVDALVVTLKKGGSVRWAAEASSPEVAAVKVGDKVVPVAVHGEWALVSIGSSTTAAPSGWLAGDVLEDALKAMIAAKQAPPVAHKPGRVKVKAGAACPSGYLASPFAGDTCEKVCKTQADCDPGDKCVQLGPVELPDKQCHH
jgi:hypothetical protein